MNGVQNTFDKIDQAITSWMIKYSVPYLRMSLALIFIWFGSLKFFPGVSPTIGLIERTTDIVTFGNLPSTAVIFTLAATECLIGLGMLFNVFMRTTLLLLFLQMLATSTPIVLLPDVVFTQAPLALTMEGHHIIKNLILIGAGLAIGATVRTSQPALVNQRS